MRVIKLIHIVAFATIFFSQQQVYAGSISKGRGVYQQHCASCHGTQGRSSMPGAPHFKRGQGIMKPDHLLVDHLRRGKNACPSFLGLLKDEQMEDVVSYIRTMYP